MTFSARDASVEAVVPFLGNAASMPHIEITSDLEKLSRVASFADDFAREQGVGAAVAYRLGLILEELVVNTIEHGYGEDEGTIEIFLDVDGEKVRLELRDRARAYDPFSAPAPDPDAPLEARRPGGLGIHLIRELAQDWSYERVDGENRVTLFLSLETG